jgi:hypothetical protein
MLCLHAADLQRVPLDDQALLRSIFAELTATLLPCECTTIWQHPTNRIATIGAMHTGAMGAMMRDRSRLKFGNRQGRQ